MIVLCRWLFFYYEKYFFIDSVLFLVFYLSMILRFFPEESLTMRIFILFQCNTCVVSLYFFFLYFIVIKTSIEIILKKKRGNSNFCSFLFNAEAGQLIFVGIIFLYSKSSTLYKCKKTRHKRTNQTSVSK